MKISKAVIRKGDWYAQLTLHDRKSPLIKDKQTSSFKTRQSLKHISDVRKRHRKY